MKQILNIGTRKSPLALRQVELVIAALQQQVPDFAALWDVQVVPMMTSGDRFLDAKLADIGGKGLFTKEIDAALLAKEVDITVHSAKDMPTQLPDGIDWPCVLPRADARDYYISSQYPDMRDLPAGAVIGTASLRRQLWLKHYQPGVDVVPIRGNVQTRLKKLESGEVDATILAAAGLERLGMKPPGHTLDIGKFIPAPAQGVVAIHCREGDGAVAALLSAIHCQAAFTQALIERQLMRYLDGSCRVPIAAYVTLDGQAFTLHAMLGNEDSGQLATRQASGDVADYVAITKDMAASLKAELAA